MVLRQRKLKRVKGRRKREWLREKEIWSSNERTEEEIVSERDIERQTYAESEREREREKERERESQRERVRDRNMERNIERKWELSPRIFFICRDFDFSFNKSFFLQFQIVNFHGTHGEMFLYPKWVSLISLKIRERCDLVPTSNWMNVTKFALKMIVKLIENWKKTERKLKDNNLEMVWRKSMNYKKYNKMDGI